jgi:hypothetical protein
MSTNETTDTRRTEPIDWTRAPDSEGQTVYWYRCMGDGFMHSELGLHINKDE